MKNQMRVREVIRSAFMHVVGPSRWSFLAKIIVLSDLPLECGEISFPYRSSNTFHELHIEEDVVVTDQSASKDFSGIEEVTDVRTREMPARIA